MQIREALILFSVLSTLTTLTKGQNKSCGNDFKTLEKALLQTDNNTLEIMKAFYPPRQPQATFVKVNYMFQDKDGNITCNKTWLWSSVEFYLIQPPSIFQLMSLFFTITHGRITTANITFKDECQDLVTWNENGSCTCTSNSLLDILTQRLKFYAKANNPDDINIDDDSLGAAVCDDLQEKEYNSGTVLAPFICGIIVSISLTILLVVMVLSVCKKISTAMQKEQNHANLAAFALTGLVFSTFVVALDIRAWVLVDQEKHEFTNHSNFVSLSFVKVTTVLDTGIVLFVYIIVLYLSCFICCKGKYCCKEKCCWKLDSTLWIVATICIAPLFCIFSHSQYIIMAWVSDHQHPGPVTYLYIISFFYYFISFRQLYESCSEFCHPKDKKKIDKHTATYGTTPLMNPAERHQQHAGDQHQQKEAKVFNHSAFFIEIWCGVILVGVQCSVLYSLIALPVTVAAPTGVYFAQLAIIIITGLFTYNFIYTEDRPKRLIKAFVNNFKNTNHKKSDEDDAEAAGKVLGEMASKYMQQKPMSQDDTGEGTTGKGSTAL